MKFIDKFLNTCVGYIQRTHFISLICFWGLFYLPAFIIPFSFHDDGNLISGVKGDIFNGYLESSQAFFSGRPLLGIFTGLQTSLIHDVWHLSINRLISFIFLIFFCKFFYNFLIKRCFLDQFCSKLISLSILCCPVTILFIVWVEEFSAGALTSVLALMSYILADHAQDKFKRQTLQAVGLYICSAFLFFIALLFYPPVAMSVFAFGFIKLTCLRIPLNELRRILVRDILLWPCVMLVYLLVVKFIVFPCALKIYHNSPDQNNLYQFAVGFSFTHKLKLFSELFIHFLKGPLDFLHGVWGWLSLSALILIITNLRIKNPRVYLSGLFKSSHLILLFEKLAWASVFFILANAPILFAKGCDTLPGYRVLFPVSLIWVVMMYAFSDFNSLLTRKLATLVLLFLIALSSVNMANVVFNSHEEYQRITHQLKGIDFPSTKRILFLLKDSGDYYLGWKPGLDLGYHSTMFEHDIFYIHKALPKNTTMPTIEGALNSQVFYNTPGTSIIDLVNGETDLQKILQRPEAINVSYSPTDPNLTIIASSKEGGTGSIIHFDQVLNENKKISYWTSNADYSYIQLESHLPRNLVYFSSLANGVDTHGTSKPIVGLLQGSNDEKSWVNLNAHSQLVGTAHNMSLYKLFNDQSFHYFRIYWYKDSTVELMRILSVVLIFNQ